MKTGLSKERKNVSILNGLSAQDKRLGRQRVGVRFTRSGVSSLRLEPKPAWRTHNDQVGIANESDQVTEGHSVDALAT
jgi:hypothetical protein